ncbi:hypothetical protein N7474_010706 [Penicillium riverlandense]|uniref:uncharacterized protein n=1 Tax=Penicillium riverlandense TaxID=1903569 RepID=UPI002549019C|nr:uncharacterized protein N7474_010706 [Penicillium riverlandense]KAJ5804819.1 hypothetical protein N7474_010706 [Penicillium riverlandense]
MSTVDTNEQDRWKTSKKRSGCLAKQLRSLLMIIPTLREDWSNLGFTLRSRYERTGHIEDLEEAIQVSRQAVKVTTSDHPGLAAVLYNLENKLERRYERIGQIDDLEEAIQVSRQMVKAAPSDHPSLVVWLSNLGNKLESRYERTGQIEDLEEAIHVTHQAVKITPNDHPVIAAVLYNLENKPGRRYERTGQIEDLEEAIQVSRQAVMATPSDHPDLAAWLNNLGNKLESRYKRTGQMAALEEAIRVSRQAVAATPDDHPNLARGLSNLGFTLRSRYERTGHIEDLEEAIQVSRQAVKVTTSDHPGLAAVLYNLGNKLRCRYERIGQMDNLEEAIQVSRQAVQTTLDYHPDLGMWLQNLGINLVRRFERIGQIDDLEEAIQVSRQAVQTKSAPPLPRITAALLTVRLMLKREDHHGGYALSVQAIDLLQLVYKRSLTIQDRQYVISHSSGLATYACALALQTGQSLFKALALLERGRGIILSLLIDDRSDTSQLKRAHPILCAQYESLRIEASVHFNRDSPQSKMKDASNEGSIIVVNVTSLRSDAIVVSSAGFSLIPLPRFSAAQAQSWVDQELTSASPCDRGVKNKSYRQFLVWLWRECVKPILTELGNSVQSSLEDLPRVWWIGTGLASSFPFHAACDISTGENTFCRVLSSYTPSIKALQHARERVSISTPTSENPSKLPMVTMANTPGADDLPGVKAERSTVVRALGNSVQVELLDQPDSASVMRQIRECNIAHFACHGTSDSDDPSQSGLLLQTATANPRQDILSVLKLCENYPTLGEIAYLSACSTAENQAKRLIDEVLHVVSGFQVAGFRHVIGTLWPSEWHAMVNLGASGVISQEQSLGLVHYFEIRLRN